VGLLAALAAAVRAHGALPGIGRLGAHLAAHPSQHEHYPAHGANPERRGGLVLIQLTVERRANVILVRNNIAMLTIKGI
jgi:hypothetical protein